MPIPLISRKTLVANIAYVCLRSQEDPEKIDNPDIFLASLLKFRERLRSDGQPTVSDAALRGWINANAPSVPKRREAMAFLQHYLQSISLDTVELTERKKDYLEALNKFFLDQNISQNPIEHRQASTPFSLGHNIFPMSNAGIAINSHQIREKLHATAGTYQIIRPYANQPGSYILEPMAINIDYLTNYATVIMYSHNQLDRKFMYSGPLFISSRYLFSLIQRTHERTSELASVRCLTIYSGHQSGGSVYEERYCLSGIILRGVQGNTGYQGPVAVPFIAIRANNDPANLIRPDFIHLHSSLHRITKNSFILIGEINHNYGDIFKFCNRIFSSIKDSLFSDMNIRTITPKSVENCIDPLASSKESFFRIWKDAANSYFKEYDARGLR